MSNIYEPKRLNGKLVAKNIDTGSIAPESLIRYIQIRNAEKNNQVLINFVRFKVGEGIDKKESDFATEVKDIVN